MLLNPVGMRIVRAIINAEAVRIPDFRLKDPKFIGKLRQLGCRTVPLTQRKLEQLRSVSLLELQAVAQEAPYVVAQALRCEYLNLTCHALKHTTQGGGIGHGGA